MDAEELIKAVGSPDFEKKLKAFSLREKAARESETAMRMEREKLDGKFQELRKIEERLEGKDLKAKNREQMLLKRQREIDAALSRVTALEGELLDREKAANDRMAEADEKIRRADKLIESNARERERLQRRHSYLDKIPA